MSKFNVFYKRNLVEESQEFDTIPDCIYFINNGLKHDSLFPDRIEEDGKEIWKQDGPFNMTQQLLDLFESHK